MIKPTEVNISGISMSISGSVGKAPRKGEEI